MLPSLVIPKSSLLPGPYCVSTRSGFVTASCVSGMLPVVSFQTSLKNNGNGPACPRPPPPAAAPPRPAPPAPRPPPCAPAGCCAARLHANAVIKRTLRVRIRSLMIPPKFNLPVPRKYHSPFRGSHHPNPPSSCHQH